jgi:hypothetical protein
MPFDVTILAPGYLAEGGEVRVNSTTFGSQFDPSVATLADGGYVVTWTSGFQDGSGLGVYAQRFDASGVPQGAETQVNTTAASDQGNSWVTGLAGGGYVVAWMSLGQDGDSWGIYTQRFNVAGLAQGGETQVNTTTVNAQFLPAIASLAGGGYVVTWQSLNQDGDNFGI